MKSESKGGGGYPHSSNGCQPARNWGKEGGGDGEKWGKDIGKMGANGKSVGTREKLESQPADTQPLWVADNLQRNVTHPLYGSTGSMGEKRQHCERGPMDWRKA